MGAFNGIPLVELHRRNAVVLSIIYGCFTLVDRAVSIIAYSKGSFFVLRPILRKLHISAQTIDGVPVVDLGRIKKLSFLLPAHAKRSSSEHFQFSSKFALSKAVLFFLRPILLKLHISAYPRSFRRRSGRFELDSNSSGRVKIPTPVRDYNYSLQRLRSAWLRDWNMEIGKELDTFPELVNSDR